MIDIFILAVALALSLIVAFVTSGLNHANILVPADRRQPVPAPNQPVLFRFTTVGKVRDRTTFKARLLVALVILVALALFGKLVLAPTSSWDTIIGGLALIALISLYFIGGWINGTAILVITFVPAGIGYWLELSPTWIGVLAGILFGSFGGMFVSFNWRGLIARMRLELKHNETIDGHKVSTFGRKKRQFHILFLRLVPLMVLYNLVVFWWPSIEIGEIAREMGSKPTRYTLLVIGLGVGVNIVLFIVPLIREMLEKGTLETAYDFTKAVSKFHRRKATQPIGDDDVGVFLSQKGTWQMFSPEQIWVSLAVVTMLAAVSMGGLLKMAVNSGQIPAAMIGTDTFADLFTPFGFARIFAGVGFCANVMFIIGLIASMPTARDDDEKENGETDADGSADGGGGADLREAKVAGAKDVSIQVRQKMDRARVRKSDDTERLEINRDAAEIYMETLWHSLRHPGTLVVCRKETGGDPVVLLYDPAADAPPASSATESDADADANAKAPPAAVVDTP